jgi:truncated hemoglobin YjbI
MADNNRFYHGTRAALRAGDLIEPRKSSHVYLTPKLDEAIWEAELADGDGPGRVYVVDPIGQVGNVSDLADWKSPGHPSMSCWSRESLRIVGEVIEWSLYHGTRADLKPGDLIEPGYNSNYGKREQASYVYVSRTLDAATWGAELAVGEGAGRIYVVEPTGPIEDDPNLTNKRFRGNPTKSFRSRHPLRVVSEITHWQGHSPEALKAMKEHLERLEHRAMQTVYDAAGGREGLTRLAAAWHARVLQDEVVSHAFSHGYHPEHTERLAAYWAEALGGPATYSERYGDETSVIRIHSGNGLHEEMDQRAIACFDQALEDVGFARDERLRRVLHDYFAWATSTTMARYHRSPDDVPDGLHIPKWSWNGLVG